MKIRRLKQLEEENARLKRLVADPSLDKTMLRDVLRKMVRPGVRREVVEVLDQLVRVRGKPRSLRVDGPEFAGRLLDHWARLAQGSVRRSRREWRGEGHLNKVEIDFSRPGRPTDNAFIEAFDARLRAECLNASWFLSPADAWARIEGWRHHTNEERLHSALGNLIPSAFANQAGQARKVAWHPDQSQG